MQLTRILSIISSSLFLTFIIFLGLWLVRDREGKDTEGMTVAIKLSIHGFLIFGVLTILAAVVEALT